jgi:hypothetical protein
MDAIDTSVPHAARRYNYWLGGKDNFAADRASGDAIAQAYPGVILDARANRAWMTRVVHTLAEHYAVRQFIDLGVGLPLDPNVHETAQLVDPSCRVLYVDNDTLVMTHARALLTGTDEGTTDYAECDITDPAVVLAAAKKTLDFDQPIAVLAIAVLHFITDDQQAHDIIDQLSAALPGGSYLAVSHFTVDYLDERTARKIEGRVTKAADGPFRPRTRGQFAAFVAGRPLLDPGICLVDQWRPDPRLLEASELEVAGGVHANVYAAVARIDRTGGFGRVNGPFPDGREPAASRDKGLGRHDGGHR